MGDAASGAVAGQKTPNGSYNIERTLKLALSRGARVSACGTCMDARGIVATALVDGAKRGSMGELTNPAEEADRVLVF